MHMQCIRVAYVCILRHLGVCPPPPLPGTSRKFPPSPLLVYALSMHYGRYMHSICTNMHAYNMHTYAGNMHMHMFALIMHTLCAQTSICSQYVHKPPLCKWYMYAPHMHSVTCFSRICTHIRVYALDMHFFRRYASICIKYADSMHFLFFQKKNRETENFLTAYRRVLPGMNTGARVGRCLDARLIEGSWSR